MDPGKQRVIRASEVGQYKFCARAWWLDRVMGNPSTNRSALEDGEAAHRWHGRTVWAVRVLTLAALVLVALALITLILVLLQVV